MLLEEALITEETLLQPLRIIEPVDADDQIAPDRGIAHPAVHQPRRGRARGGDEFLCVDTDRIDQQPYAAPIEVEDAILFGGAKLDDREIAEGFEPFLGMEADHVISEHRAGELGRFGQGREEAARRPRNVEEEADPVGTAAVAQRLAEREHVIILDPQHVVGLDQRQHRIGEAIVHPLVAAGETALIFGQIDAIVEERPQCAVGVAVIIFLDVLLLQVDRRGGDAVVALEVDAPVELLGSLARPAEPDAAIFAQRRLHRDGQPALRAAGGRWGRDAIGDDDQPVHRIALHGLLSKTAQLMMPTSE